MRLSELAGKELVDIREGIRLGELGQADLVFETRTGKVRAVVVGPHGPWWRRARELVIPWRGVRKIGVDLIVVDLGAADPEALHAEEGSAAAPSAAGEGSGHGYGSWEREGWHPGPQDGEVRGPSGLQAGPVFFRRR